MNRRVDRIRQTAKGGALAAALFFMIVVTTAGIALLGSSTRNQIAIIERSVDVRLMIAVESSVESVRGRFKLVENVQEDWSWMAGKTISNPYDLGYVTINGISCHLQSWPIGDPSVPRCTVRGSASAAGITRFVEMDLKVPSFADYCMFSGGTRASDWGDIEIFGRFHSNADSYFESVNTIFHLVPSFGKNSSTTWAAPFASMTGGYQSYMGFQPYVQNDVVMPSDVAVYSAIENAGKRSRTNSNSTSDDHVYFENTLEIQFRPDHTYRRIFVRRNSNISGTVLPPSWENSSIDPTNGSTTIATNDTDLAGIYRAHPTSLPPAVGSSWLNCGGLSNTSTGYARNNLNVVGAPQNWYDTSTNFGTATGAHWTTDNAWYDLCWEIVPIPDEGVIYVKIGSPDLWGSDDDSTGSQRNKYTQRHVNFNDVSLNIPDSRNDSARTPICLISGMLDSDRVTIAGDGVNMVIRNNIIYKTYADNPSLRTAANKDTQATVDDILGEEMLGVISKPRMIDTATPETSTTGRIGGGDINAAFRFWQHLGLASSKLWWIHTWKRLN